MSTTTKSKHNNIFIKIIIILLLVIAHIGFIKSISTIITNRSAIAKYGSKSSQKFGKIVNIWNGRTRYYIDVESKDGFNDKRTFTFDVSYLEARELNINDIYKFETTTPLAPKSYNDYKNDSKNANYLLPLYSIILFSVYIIVRRTFGQYRFEDITFGDIISTNVKTKYNPWCELGIYSLLLSVLCFGIFDFMLITSTISQYKLI